MRVAWGYVFAAGFAVGVMAGRHPRVGMNFSVGQRNRAFAGGLAARSGPLAGPPGYPSAQTPSSKLNPRAVSRLRFTAAARSFHAASFLTTPRYCRVRAPRVIQAMERSIIGRCRR